MKIKLFILLCLLPVAVLTGCKTNSGISDEQKSLIALAKAVPTNSSPNEAWAVEAGLDRQTNTVLELVNIFMTNRDWTESLSEERLAAWHKTHPYTSPPVIIHEKQMEAAYQLSQLGPRAVTAAPAMIQSLTNSEFLTHQWATRQNGINSAIEQRADFMNRHWAILVLQAIGTTSSGVVPALVFGLDDPQTGYEAAGALVTISQIDTNVLSAVIDKIDSNPDSPEARNSVQVLNGIGSKAGAAVPALIQLLEHTNACDDVVRTLGTIGSDAGPAVPHLLHLYQQSQGDGNFARRKQIVIALGKIGPSAKEAVPMLQGLRNRPYESFDAVDALWRIDPQFTQLAIGEACKILQAKATPDRDKAIKLLGDIGPPAQFAIPLIMNAADKYAELRPAANLAIERIGSR